MNIADLVHSIGETIGATATVKSVYGEPVTLGQRVVLPVAKIRYAFGGGGGGREGESPKGGGGGGCGRVLAQPCGLVEVTPEGARFVYFQEPAILAAAAAAGFLLGLLVAYSRRPHTDAESV